MGIFLDLEVGIAYTSATFPSHVPRLSDRIERRPYENDLRFVFSGIHLLRIGETE